MNSELRDLAKMLDAASEQSTSRKSDALAESLKTLGFKWKGSRLTLSAPFLPSGIDDAIAEAQKSGVRFDYKLSVCPRTLNMVAAVSFG